METETKDLELRIELVQIIRQVKSLKVRAKEIQEELAGLELEE